MLHIGNAIKEELTRQGRSVSWLASQIPCDRSNVYNILRRQSIDSALLFIISRLLEHNFFADLSEEYRKESAKENTL